MAEKRSFKKETFRQTIRHKRLLVDENSMGVCSDEIGISKSTLSRVEAGRPFDLETFVKIINWLGYDANHFIRE